MKRLAGVLAVGALLLAGCGGAEDPPAPKPVRLALTSPADGTVVDGDAVTITGTVAPAGAQVLVRGRDADVLDGRFSAEIALDPGANVIDVAAAAPDRRPALAALRVVRRMPVTIPDLEGEPPDTAVAQLEALGLQAEIRESGGLFDDLLPGTDGVCGTDPGAGESVRVGTTVEVEVARSC